MPSAVNNLLIVRGRSAGERLMVAVAQLAEHKVVVLGVAGSSPVSHPFLFANMNACGVAVEMLGIGQGDDARGIGRQAGRVITCDAPALEEFVHADAAGETGRGVGRQAMAWTGDVVPRRHRRERTDENRAGVNEFLIDQPRPEQEAVLERVAAEVLPSLRKA